LGGFHTREEPGKKSRIGTSHFLGARLWMAEWSGQLGRRQESCFPSKLAGFEGSLKHLYQEPTRALSPLPTDKPKETVRTLGRRACKEGSAAWQRLPDAKCELLD
jgi:hypothetical protein